MNTPPTHSSQAEPASAPAAPRPPRFQWPILLAAMAIAAMLGALAWPRPTISVWDRSREDGKSRFYETRPPKYKPPPGFSLLQRAQWEWYSLPQRLGWGKTITLGIGPSPTNEWAIHTLVQTCASLSKTRYLLAVEVSGIVSFGTPASLPGTQWIAAVEQTLTNTKSILCYDYAGKTNFEDSLVFVHDSPGIVKIVPHSKWKHYTDEGLIRSGRP